MAKAVVFFAEGTEECEALLVVDLLRRAKVEVLVASASGSREILSSHKAVPYTHLGAHDTGRNFVCRLLLAKQNETMNRN